MQSQNKVENKEIDKVRFTVPSSTLSANQNFSSELHGTAPILLFWYSSLLNCFAFSSSKS